MKSRTTAARSIVLLCLLSFFSTAGAPLRLDIESPVIFERALETHHSADCPYFHNHWLCVLLFRTPWAAPRRQMTPVQAAAVVAVTLRQV